MSTAERSKHKGGNFTPALCNILGILILLTVIASYLPLSIPRLMGYELYDIVSESMTPAIPVGSVIYVQQTDNEQLAKGDVIAFVQDGEVIAHRVVSNEVVTGRLVTKGDANDSNDLFPVEYSQVVGLVVYHIPVLGGLMMIYAGTAGKIYALMFAACGVMLNVLAGRMRAVRRSAAVEEYIREHTTGKDDET